MRLLAIGPLDGYTDIPPGAGDASIDAGAVRVRTITAEHMQAKEMAAIVSRGALGVKFSAKTQTLSAMLAIGSTITRKGCDTLRGPTCNVT